MLSLHGGEFNGTMIGNKVKTDGSAEGHMWPYKGGDLIPADVTFNGNKTLDGEEPGTKQFAFLMYELDKSTGWKYVMTAFNKEDGLIQFAPLEFGEQGHYYYLFFEKPGQNKPGITLDSTKYVVEVEVKPEGGPGQNTQLAATHKYYKVTDLEDINELLELKPAPPHIGGQEYGIKHPYLDHEAESIELEAGQTSRDAIQFDNTERKSALKISKKVVSPVQADHNADYTFEIQLDYDTEITGVYSGVQFTDGHAIVTIHGNGTKTITGLPEGAGYTIREVTSSLGEKFTFNPSSATITGNEIGENGVEAEFTNTRKVGSLKVKSRQPEGQEGVWREQRPDRRRSECGRESRNYLHSEGQGWKRHYGRQLHVRGDRNDRL